MIKYLILVVAVVLLVGGSLWCGSCREWFKPKVDLPLTTPTSTSKLPAHLPVSDLIKNINIHPDDQITSPLLITGEARGPWYFEASFPIVLTDWDGKIIAQGHAEAQGEWMTENFVPFKAMLEFNKPSYGERGALILQKDNPSGLSENDAALEIPIRFK